MQLKQILQGHKTQAKIDIGNTVEYDVNSYQVKMTVVKCTKVRLELLKLDHSHK